MVGLCLKDLDPKYREIITLFYFEDLDYRSIADITGVPTSTVGVRLRRAKEKLKAVCKKHNHESK